MIWVGVYVGSSTTKMKIDPKEISIDFTQDDEDWSFEALWRGQRVGHAWCTRNDDNLIIEDIKVEDDHRMPWSIMNSWLFMICNPKRSVNFRHHGVGNRLMDRVIMEAKTSQIHNIWGSVTQDDINRAPYLLDWYQRHGFSITDPDDNCIKNAAKKIVMKL